MATRPEAPRDLVNPSPPPAPSKWGTSWATPNDVVNYYVEATVPAGTTYHDLAYTLREQAVRLARAVDTFKLAPA